jgi:hypothetical protein
MTVDVKNVSARAEATASPKRTLRAGSGKLSV